MKLHKIEMKVIEKTVIWDNCVKNNIKFKYV